MTRPWPAPIGGDTIHFIGDLHFGSVPASRTDKILHMIQRSRLLPEVRATVQLGDLVHNGLNAEDALAIPWMDQVDPDWLMVIGGHDFWNYVRTPTAAAVALGTELHYTRDYAGMRLLVIDPETMGGQIPTATLDWLDDELAAAGDKDCWIACHYPLFDTVGGDSGTHYNSTTNGFYAIPDSNIRSVLGAYPNSKAWISAHTHSDIELPSLVTPVIVGGHTIAAVNCSSPYYMGKTFQSTDPMATAYVTRRSDGVVDVRFRNWGAGVWTTSNGSRVLTA